MNSLNENLENIKEKLIAQIREKYPLKESEKLIININSMNEEEFISFLRENGLLGEEENSNCIFCSMVFGHIPTTKIGENNAAIAILELNPISKGHTLIIPKNHVSFSEEIGEATKELAQEVSKKIMEKFQPNKVEIISSNIMGHEILNVLPIYESENLDSPRNKKTHEELAELKSEFDKEISNLKEEKIKESTKEEIDYSEMKRPKRLP